MSKKDFYQILGADKKASADELKKSYRKLAMQYHPDKNPGNKEAEAKFKEISEAYDVLKDDQKRAAYDRFGHGAFAGGMGGAGAGAGAQGFSGGFGGFGDIFEEMFGDFMGGQQRRGGAGGDGARRGADLSYEMEITLEDSFHGKEAPIKVASWQPCGGCSGSGAEKGTKADTCDTCRGMGRIRAQQGFFTVERTCPSCGGAGQTIKTPCSGCGGSGRTRKEKSLKVAIPAGVEDGTRIRLAGEGEAGLRGGPAGDLYVFLGIKPHRFFQREASNLYCRVPVPITTVALGGNIEVPTIDGKRMKVAVPSGTQTGQQFRLKGKGMTVLRSPNRGDMFVEVVVETPVNLSKRQKEILQEFAGDTNDKTNPQSAGFFEKVKGLWEDLKD
ncbi:MAG: molecular chaperone DnaJ [Alphaproteobacteria bacterium]|nr:molecular chaperone DnaJ [Alphaproteobacteria bacterium]